MRRRKGLPAVSARHRLTNNSGRKGKEGKVSEIANVGKFNLRIVETPAFGGSMR